MNQIQRVDDALALIVIVGDDKSRIRMRGNLLDAFRPGFQFFFRVKIIVTFILGNRWIVGEPSVVAATMQSYVTDGGSDAFAGHDGTADYGLVNVTESDVEFLKQGVQFSSIPRRMPHFYDEWIVVESFRQAFQVSQRVRSVMKRKRELNKYRAQTFRIAKNIETCANAFLVFERCAVFVREFLPELCGEEESRIGDYLLDPSLHQLRTKGLVERRVDFNRVEILREVCRLVKTARLWARIDDSLPVRV